MMETAREKKEFSFLKKSYIWYFLYVVIVFVLAHCIWPQIRTNEFLMYQYSLDLNIGKTLVCFFIALIISFFVCVLYTEKAFFSSRVVLLLSLLYFIPGLAIGSALNFDWGYTAAFLAYYIVLLWSDYCLGHRTARHILINRKQEQLLSITIITFCLFYPIVMALIYRKTFSLSELILTLNDPYGVRAEAKKNNISWFFLNFEYWGVYFGSLMITYLLKKKKTILGIAFITIELFYFLLQGNRVFLFITALAIFFGFVSIDNRYIPVFFVGLLVIQCIEYLLFNNTQSLGFFTNVYRRFTIVPNIIAPKYYDYFQLETPDYLRGNFSIICRFLGIESKYDFNIGYSIGRKYFASNMNANNGLVGGAFFEFGYLGMIIDPVMLAASLRWFENALIYADKEIVMVAALIYATLSINTWAIWSQCFRVSYFLFLLISIFIVFNRPATDEKLLA